MSYDALAHVIKLGGTVAFFGIFVLSIVYALWPKNKARFDHAATLPLNDSDTPEL
jgi:cytochrome c oxidase cbb3-type subunit 4